MKQIGILLSLFIVFLSCTQQSEIVSFEVDGENYKTEKGQALSAERGDVKYSVKRITGDPEKRHSDMTRTLNFLDDYSDQYLSDLDSFLILGSKEFDGHRTHLYHFFKKTNTSNGISILVQCPFSNEEIYKREIYRVVESAHF